MRDISRENMKIIEVRIYKNKRFRPIIDGVKNKIQKFNSLIDLIEKIEKLYNCKIVTKIKTPKKIWICAIY